MSLTRCIRALHYTLRPLLRGSPDSTPATGAAGAGVYTLGAGMLFLSGPGRDVVAFSFPTPGAAAGAAGAATVDSLTFLGVARRDLRSFTGSMPMGVTSSGASLGDDAAGAVETAVGFFILVGRALGLGRNFGAGTSCSFWTTSGRSEAGVRRPLPGVPLAVPRPRTRRTLGVVLSLEMRGLLAGAAGRLSSSGVDKDSASAS